MTSWFEMTALNNPDRVKNVDEMVMPIVLDLITRFKEDDFDSVEIAYQMNQHFPSMAQLIVGHNQWTSVAIDRLIPFKGE